MIIFNYSTIIDPLLRGTRIYALKFSGIKTGEKVLDVCCGTGDQVFHYAEKGIIAAGIDLDPGMIEVVKKNQLQTEKRYYTKNGVIEMIKARN